MTYYGAEKVVLKGAGPRPAVTHKKLCGIQRCGT